mmetsp:Transcript_43324/g.138344  ORF Transcript_43324/g.138344 Transcript_43324/m.138344 type:complete len:318 (+) Transcript_43324:44-997(+)
MPTYSPTPSLHRFQTKSRQQHSSSPYTRTQAQRLSKACSSPRALKSLRSSLGQGARDVDSHDGHPGQGHQEAADELVHAHLVLGVGGEEHERWEDEGEGGERHATDEAEELAEGGDARGGEGGGADEPDAQEVLAHHRHVGEPALDDAEGTAGGHGHGEEEVQAEEHLDDHGDEGALEMGDHHAVHVGAKAGRAHQAKRGGDDCAEDEPLGGRGHELLAVAHGVVDGHEGEVHEEEERDGAVRRREIAAHPRGDARQGHRGTSRREAMEANAGHAENDGKVPEEGDEREPRHVADERERDHERRDAHDQEVLGGVGR